MFPVDEIIDRLRETNYRVVALQFPDDLLHLSFCITEQLKSSLSSCQIFTLADTSYGSCCIDEVAAEHVNADLIIHFGDSCLSLPSRFRVWWYFQPDESFNSKAFLEACSLLNFSAKKTFLISQVSCLYALREIKQELPNGVFLLEAHRSFDPADHCTCSYFYNRILPENECLEGDYQILFVGVQNCPLFANISIEESRKGKAVLVYDSLAGKIFPIEESLPTSEFIKRLRLIEKISSCECFGIVVGTVSVALYREVIARVKATIKKYSKSFFTLVLGKINEAKLANFSSVDAFVYIGCSESSILSKGTILSGKPIVSPLELHLGLSGDPFSQRYSVSFSDFLEIPLPETPESTSTQISTYGSPSRLAMIAYQSLEYEVPEDRLENLQIFEGKRGTAQGYSNEKSLLGKS